MIGGNFSGLVLVGKVVLHGILIHSLQATAHHIAGSGKLSGCLQLDVRSLLCLLLRIFVYFRSIY